MTSIYGHEGVARALVEMFRDLGDKTARGQEKRQGLAEGSIRFPSREHIYPTWVDNLSKGNFPAIMVVPQDTPIRRTARAADFDGLYTETQWRYPFMIVVQVSGDNEATTELERFRLMLVVRTILIQVKLLLKDDVNLLAKAEIDLDDMQEIMSGGARNPETKKYLAEGATGFHVRTTESTPALLEPYRPVAGFDLEVEAQADPTPLPE